MNTHKQTQKQLLEINTKTIKACNNKKYLQNARNAVNEGLISLDKYAQCNCATCLMKITTVKTCLKATMDFLNKIQD